jgi:hypothetical protein
MELFMSSGANAVIPEPRHRLAESKDKDCDRQPHRYVGSLSYERGKACWNAKGVDPDDQHVGRASVVVRVRESRSHGEGGQFKTLGVHIN